MQDDIAARVRAPGYSRRHHDCSVVRLDDKRATARLAAHVAPGDDGSVERRLATLKAHLAHGGNPLQRAGVGADALEAQAIRAAATRGEPQIDQLHRLLVRVAE